MSWLDHASAIWGDRWVTPMAKALGRDTRTVARWKASALSDDARNPCPDSVKQALHNAALELQLARSSPSHGVRKYQAQSWTQGPGGGNVATISLESGTLSHGEIVNIDGRLFEVQGFDTEPFSNEVTVAVRNVAPRDVAD